MSTKVGMSLFRISFRIVFHKPSCSEFYENGTKARSQVKRTFFSGTINYVNSHKEYIFWHYKSFTSIDIKNKF